ncbi:MAG: YcaO-like family protein [Bacteroidaceae bacterium]|nr:YcaO-like family protein [Bacteroidaceae bacterium]
MKRNYKNDTPENTVLKIRRILDSLNIITYESSFAHPYENYYSNRLQLIDTQGGFGQNGKGTSLEYCLASAYAELMERIENGFFLGLTSISLPFLSMLHKKYGYYFFPDEKYISYDEFLELPSEFLDDIFSGISETERRELLRKYYKRIQENGSKGVVSVPFYDCLNHKTVYLPYNFLSVLTGSNGMAAGNNASEGVFQGMCEILERYAATKVFHNMLTPPTIPDEYLNKFPKQKKMIEELSQDGFSVIVKDFSIGKKLPVVGVIVIDSASDKYRMNIGCDTSFEVALNRALTEVYQGSKNRDDILKIMLDVPHKEYDYFLDDSEESLRKRDAEITQFKINGCGKYPFSLFGSNESYAFDPDAFVEHKTYEEEVNYLLNLFKTLGHRVFLRNTSFLGFPAFYVYVPELSALGQKLGHASGSSMTIDSYLRCDDEEKIFLNFENLFTDTDVMRKILDMYANKSAYHDNKVSSLLKLEMSDGFYWSKLPLSYILIILAFILKQYDEAIFFLERYRATMHLDNDEYYNNVKKFLTYKKEGKSDDFISNNINKDIINGFAHDTLINSVEYPSCPNCDECKLYEGCITAKKISVWQRIAKEMSLNTVDQKATFEYLNK